MQFLSCTATLVAGIRQCNSCNALPQCLGAVGSATPVMHCLTAWGDGESCLPPGSVAVHCMRGHWALQLWQYTAPLPWGSRIATPAMDCHTASGQWALSVLQCTSSLPGDTWGCNSCHALPHCLAAVGSGTPAMHCHTASGQWALQLVSCNDTLPWGGGHWNSCHALPHCPGAVGSATLVIQRLTAAGSGQCNSCPGVAMPTAPRQ